MDCSDSSEPDDDIHGFEEFIDFNDIYNNKENISFGTDIDILPYKHLSDQHIWELIEYDMIKYTKILNSLLLCENLINQWQCLHILQSYKWNISRIKQEIIQSTTKITNFYILCQILKLLSSTTDNTNYIKNQICEVCLTNLNVAALSCGHSFCLQCWETYIGLKLTKVSEATFHDPDLTISTDRKRNDYYIHKENNYNLAPSINTRPLRSTYKNPSFSTSNYLLNSYESEINVIYNFPNNKTPLGLKRTGGITCMHTDCEMEVTFDFIESYLSRTIKDSYKSRLLNEIVKAHPKLTKCPNLSCEAYMQSNESLPKKIICDNCQSQFCFLCREPYHAPCDCLTIALWTKKCSDDSETLNYLRANTKDACRECKHEFCWMCLKDWSTHNKEYSQCSNFENEDHVFQTDSNTQDSIYQTFHSNKQISKATLERYLFYYSRWENHKKSLEWEELNIKSCIEQRSYDKMLQCQGTWIDWQYLSKAADLLIKCRHTLQYSYPYLHFAPPNPQRYIFQKQLSQLEIELENLSWKLERVEINHKAVSN
ncbi:unnamed protein product [Gordionus sp. m RMFG-2023]